MKRPRARPTSPFEVFRNREFSLLWSAEFTSTSGSALTTLASYMLIYRLTGSALDVGLMLIASAAPSLFVGLFAGVFVDRFDRKRIMVIADLLRALCVCSVPLLVHQNVGWLYFIVGLNSALTQFYEPARESALPEIVSEKSLAAATSLTEISSFGSAALGFLVVGAIASAGSLDVAFYLDGMTFIFSGMCVMAAHIPSHEETGETSMAAVGQNLTVGLRHIEKTESLRSLFILYFLVFILLGQWNAMQLPFYTLALGASEFQYSMLEAVGAAGFGVGSLALVRFAARLHEGQWLTISFLGMAFSCLVFSLSPIIPLALTMFAFQGVLNAPSVVARRLMIQRHTPRALRGRVVSAFYVWRDLVWMLGMALAGLADRFDVRALMVVNSSTLLLTALFSARLPGLGETWMEWRRMLQLLRGERAAPRLGVGRAATLADFDLLAGHLPEFAALSLKDRRNLASQSLVADAPGGTVVVARGERSDSAYFVLNGAAAAGYLVDDEYVLLDSLGPGDFFGEFAALTGAPRTANVITEEPTTLLQMPAPALKQLLSNAQLEQIFTATMRQRIEQLDQLDHPFAQGLDQTSLRELRTKASPLHSDNVGEGSEETAL
jgi:CRP-like cAMP-binding protein/Na+/melibiose symporter-like transporter